MAEDILNKETAVQRMHERMVRRRRSALDKRIVAVSVCALVMLFVLIVATGWVMVSYAIPLNLPNSVEVHSLIVSDHEVLKETDFVKGLEGTGISVAFENRQGERLGWQEIVLKFTRGRESCIRKVGLYRFQLNTSVTVPLEEVGNITARDFVQDESVAALLMTPLPKNEGGKFQLVLFCNGKDYTVECTVTEDIPPQATGKELTVEAGTRPNPMDFVENVQDHSAVTAAYKEPMEFITLGRNPVTIVLTDYFGNTAEVQAAANVVPSANGPQFTGLETIYLELGNAISYKNGVQVTDAQDGELTFTVDTGDVDTKTVGRYTVYYTAVDSDGNKVIAPRTVVVESHTGQLVREKVEQILSQIIKPGMTRDEKIRAVFNYADWNVMYVGTSDKSSIENAAYEGLTKKQGDCYTFYAIIRVMLDTLEIPNLECRRVGGTSDHWWNLVQFEDGKYYHVDATTRTIAWFTHFKMTESMIQEYTNHPDVMAHRPNYYNYDHTLPEYQNIEIAQ